MFGQSPGSGGGPSTAVPLITLVPRPRPARRIDGLVSEGAERFMYHRGVKRIPLWLKLGFSAWAAVWIPAYGSHYGPTAFLWFCDIGNFLILAGLWLESPLLISWAAVSVLLVQVAWTIDFLVALVAGVHPFRASAYMWDGSIPLFIRLVSLFHVAAPPVLLFALRRLGYDRRALAAQTLTAWVVLPVCYFFASPDQNLNWVFRPFGVEQRWLPPGAYLAACMLAYPLLLHLPSHLLLARFFGEARRR